jgi:hypothetical protein
MADIKCSAPQPRKDMKRSRLPLVIIPTIMPAAVLPLLSRAHAPDLVLGSAAGLFLGLSIIALIGFAKGGRGCAWTSPKP